VPRAARRSNVAGLGGGEVVVGSVGALVVGSGSVGFEGALALEVAAASELVGGSSAVASFPLVQAADRDATSTQLAATTERRAQR